MRMPVVKMFLVSGASIKSCARFVLIGTPQRSQVQAQPRQASERVPRYQIWSSVTLGEASQRRACLREGSLRKVFEKTRC